MREILPMLRTLASQRRNSKEIAMALRVSHNRVEHLAAEHDITLTPCPVKAKVPSAKYPRRKAMTGTGRAPRPEAVRNEMAAERGGYVERGSVHHSRMVWETRSPLPSGMMRGDGLYAGTGASMCGDIDGDAFVVWCRERWPTETEPVKRGPLTMSPSYGAPKGPMTCHAQQTAISESLGERGEDADDIRRRLRVAVRGRMSPRRKGPRSPRNVAP